MRKVELTQNSPEWLEFRKKHLGASDAPVVMEISPWRTPYQLWREKLDLDQNTFVSGAMRRGTELEPIARQKVSRILDVDLKPAVFESDLDFIAASLDAISDDGKTLVEIKCPSSKPQEQGIPRIYYPQVQHQMFVCEVEKMYFYTFYEGEGELLEINRDESYINKMIETEKEFWECVKALTPPSSAYVTRDDPAFCKAALHYQEIRKQLKWFEEKEKQAREELLALCNGQNVRNSHISVTKIVRKGNVDYQAIPELKEIDLEKYRKPSIESWRVA
jgi:putative phage-type endonuclease